MLILENKSWYIYAGSLHPYQSSIYDVQGKLKLLEEKQISKELKEAELRQKWSQLLEYFIMVQRTLNVK